MSNPQDPTHSSDIADTPNLSNPHDSLFKAVFSQVQYAADEFRHVLPPALVARLDFRTLTLRPGSFIDASLRGRFTDLLYSVSLSGRKAFLYLLFEHQSTSEHLMASRLWRYLGEIWSSYLKDHPQARRLPAVISVVLHHGSGSGVWTAPTSLHDLLDLEEETRVALSELVPSLTYMVDDVSAQRDEELRSRAMDAVPKLVFWALKHARNGEEILDTFAAWSEVLLEVWRSPTGVAALGLILRYILSVTQIDTERLRTALITHVDKQTEEALMTTAELLMQQGYDQGIQQGVQQGVQQGEQNALLLLLQERFGELPSELVERIKSAKPEQLSLWLRRILSTQSLDELFAAP